MMNYENFLHAVIERGIAGATRNYTEPKQKEMLEGSIAGFEACRNKTPLELKEVLEEAGEYLNKSYADRDKEKYWWFRCYQLEVEWTCNVVSAMLYNEGMPSVFPHLPTCNGMRAAALILGVSEI